MKPFVVALTSLAFLFAGCTMEDGPWADDIDSEFLQPTQPPDRPAHGDTPGAAGVAPRSPMPDSDFWDTGPTPDEWYPTYVDSDYEHPFDSPADEVIQIH